MEKAHTLQLNTAKLGSSHLTICRIPPLLRLRPLLLHKSVLPQHPMTRTDSPLKINRPGCNRLFLSAFLRRTRSRSRKMRVRRLISGRRAYAWNMYLRKNCRKKRRCRKSRKSMESSSVSGRDLQTSVGDCRYR